MKKISVCKNQQIIFGHVIPTGAVYGKFTYAYDRRIVTGYTFVTDKNNRRIFNKNGTPKMKPVIKEVPTKNTVIYSVESFIDYSFKGEKSRHLYAYVLFDNGNKWTEIALGNTPITQELEKMVRDYIKEHGLKEPKVAHVKTKNTRTITPNFRQANQFDSVFRMRPENTATINENVKPRVPIVHTNMDKLHPVDDKPVYSSRVKSKPVEQYVKYTRTIITTDENGKSEKTVTKIKDTVCNNPANGGYIRNTDGKVTTRDGKAVKTRI